MVLNDVTLREHLESQLKWLDKYFTDQIKAIDSNTAKAAATIDKRLESMNEFRDALKDQASRLMTRVEANAQIESLEQRMKSLELNRASGEGKMLMISGFVAFVASILVAVVTHWVIK
jgi:hypothetical protein